MTEQRFCSQCGAAAAADTKFCGQCGAPIVGAEAVSPPGETRDQYLARINQKKLGGAGAAPTTSGKPTPAKKEKQQLSPGCAITLGIILVLFVIGLIISAVGGDSSSSDGPDQYGAWDVCQQFVDRQLKSPSSSDYPDITDATITHTGGIWDVVAYVDAENSFGASIRVPFTCEVRWVGGGNWRAVDVELIE